jgi:hypothetical protein
MSGKLQGYFSENCFICKNEQTIMELPSWKGYPMKGMIKKK